MFIALCNTRMSCALSIGFTRISLKSFLGNEMVGSYGSSSLMS